MDVSGEGTIITEQKTLHTYLSLLNQQLPVESNLLEQLADHLNAEVVSGTIRSLRDATLWLGYTFLYIRMLRRPDLYGVVETDDESDAFLEQHRCNLAHSALTLLDRHGLALYDRNTGALQSTPLGRIASHYYIHHTSCALYAQQMTSWMSEIDVFRLFSLSREFTHMSVRPEEKIELSQLMDRVPIPIKSNDLDEHTVKVNILLQAYISRLQLTGFSLMTDMTYIVQSGARLARAMFEIALTQRHSATSQQLLQLCKMIQHRCWAAQSPLRQFSSTQVSSDLVRRLESTDLAFERLLDLDAPALGELVRAPKHAKQLHRLLHQLPRFDAVGQVQPMSRSSLRLSLSLTPDFEYSQALSGAAEPFHLLVEDSDGDRLLHSEFVLLRAKHAQRTMHLQLVLPIHEPLPPQYFVRLISDRWLGCELVLPVSFRQLLLPAKFSAPTELLDLAPLNCAEVGDERYMSYFIKQRCIDTFNSVQTQTFQACFGSAHLKRGGGGAAKNRSEPASSILIAAPVCNQLIVCAELCIMRALNEASPDEPTPKFLYTAVREETLTQRDHDWANGALLGLRTARLSGDPTHDASLLASNEVDLLLALPAHLDALTRRWKQRARAFARVRLVIAENLELLDTGGCLDSSAAPMNAVADQVVDSVQSWTQLQGALMETSISRLRFIAAQLAEAAQSKRPLMRLCGLSACQATASDMGEWLGCTSQQRDVFAFAASVRPLPMTMQLVPLDANDAQQRYAASLRPAYIALTQQICAVDTDNCNKPVIFWCDSKRQVRQTALEFLNQESNERMQYTEQEMHDGAIAQSRFLHHKTGAELELELNTDTISDSALVQCICAGIGALHSSQTQAEREVQLQLFSRGVLQLLVVDHALAYALPANISAYACIVLGCDRASVAQSGSSQEAQPLPLQRLSQQLSFACRPNEDARSHAFVYCAASQLAHLQRWLSAPLPTESALHAGPVLHDALLGDIVSKRCTTQQDCVDWLTWTYLYRRLVRNANFYGLSATTHAAFSDYLSELVEGVLDDLTEAKCIVQEEEHEDEAEASGGADLSPLNLGMIAAYYSLHYTSVEVFARSVSGEMRLRGLVHLVAAAQEYAEQCAPVAGKREEAALQRLAKHVPIAVTTQDFSDMTIKVNLLLQAHVSRFALSSSAQADFAHMLPLTLRLLQALIDCISSSGYLLPALACMEWSQMIVQSVWNNQSSLWQLPHVTQPLVDAAQALGIRSPNDLTSVDDAVRDKLLTAFLTESQIHALADTCNNMPGILVEIECLTPIVARGDTYSLKVVLTRDPEDPDEEDPSPPESFDEPIETPMVATERFPQPKAESWWCVLGDQKSNTLLTIKRLTFTKRRMTMQLDAIVGDNVPLGEQEWKLFLMCDAWLGVDQEIKTSATITEAQDESSEDEDEMQDEAASPEQAASSPSPAAAAT